MASSLRRTKPAPPPRASPSSTTDTALPRESCTAALKADRALPAANAAPFRAPQLSERLNGRPVRTAKGAERRDAPEGSAKSKRSPYPRPEAATPLHRTTPPSDTARHGLAAVHTREPLASDVPEPSRRRLTATLAVRRALPRLSRTWRSGAGDIRAPSSMLLVSLSKTRTAGLEGVTRIGAESTERSRKEKRTVSTPAAESDRLEKTATPSTATLAPSCSPLLTERASTGEVMPAATAPSSSKTWTETWKGAPAMTSEGAPEPRMETESAKESWKRAVSTALEVSASAKKTSLCAPDPRTSEGSNVRPLNTAAPPLASGLLRALRSPRSAAASSSERGAAEIQRPGQPLPKASVGLTTGWVQKGRRV
eukprot:2278273-Rhodomonas_salina.2